MAQAAATFSSILDRPASEIEAPKPLPQGSYVTVLVGQPKRDKSTKKQTDFVEFQHKITGAGDDVDAEALAEALGVRGLTDVVMKNTFYLTEASAWRLKDFLRDCGLDIDSDEMSIREMIEQTAGRSIGIFVKHQPTQDGQGVFAVIDHTLALD